MKRKVNKQLKVINFVYETEDGNVDWRKVKVIKSTKKFIKGIDSDKHYKTFLKKRILGRNP